MSKIKPKLKKQEMEEKQELVLDYNPIYKVNYI